MNINEIVQNLITTDDSYSGAENNIIIKRYNGASVDEREIIDDIFISLCGYSLDTIISEYNDNKGIE